MQIHEPYQPLRLALVAGVFTVEQYYEELGDLPQTVLSCTPEQIGRYIYNKLKETL